MRPTCFNVAPATRIDHVSRTDERLVDGGMNTRGSELLACDSRGRSTAKGREHACLRKLEENLVLNGTTERDRRRESLIKVLLA